MAYIAVNLVLKRTHKMDANLSQQLQHLQVLVSLYIFFDHLSCFIWKSVTCILIRRNPNSVSQIEWRNLISLALCYTNYTKKNILSCNLTNTCSVTYKCHRIPIWTNTITFCKTFAHMCLFWQQLIICANLSGGLPNLLFRVQFLLFSICHEFFYLSWNWKIN